MSDRLLAGLPSCMACGGLLEAGLPAGIGGGSEAAAWPTSMATEARWKPACLLGLEVGLGHVCRWELMLVHLDRGYLCKMQW